MNFYRTLKTSLVNTGFPTTLYDRDIRVCHLTQLRGYDLVVIAAHGGRYSYTYRKGKRTYKATISAFCIDQQHNNGSYYTKWLKDKQITKNRTGYCVLPKFFKSNYRPQSLRNTIVMSPSCNIYGGRGSGLDLSMASAFTSRGATCFVGFQNRVLDGYGRSFMTSFAQSLSQGSTCGRAMAAAKGRVGSKQSLWYQRYWPIANYWKDRTRDTFPYYTGQAAGRLRHYLNGR